MRRILLPCVLLLLFAVGCGSGGADEQAGATDAPTPGTSEGPASTESASEGTTDIAGAPAQITRCLPASGTEAELVVPDAPPRVLQLQSKLTKAIRANPEKLQQLLAEHPQEALPYREWMGVTRKEYRDLRRLSDQAHTWGLRAIATQEIGAKVTGSEAVFAAGGNLQPLDGVTIDMEAMTVDTPAGTMEEPDRLTSTSGAAGPLDGFHWSRDADAVTFDIALVKGTDQCFLQYGPGQVTAMGSTLSLRYPQNDS